MKRIFVSALILVALLAVTTGTAFAGSALELVQVRNDEGGVRFIFRVTGEFSQDELNSGFVQVEGGDDFPLYCAQKDATTVVCQTSKKAGAHSVVVGFGGARFWTDVPEASGPVQYCYPVYDYSLPEPSTFWQAQGEYCQDNAPKEGDGIRFFSPYWNSSYNYYFLPDGYIDSGPTPWTNPGEGYYYLSAT